MVITSAPTRATSFSARLSDDSGLYRQVSTALAVNRADVDGVNVQVPVGVAAQICPNVSANVIAESVGTQNAVCEIDQETAAEHNIGVGQGQGQGQAQGQGQGQSQEQGLGAQEQGQGQGQGQDQNQQ